MLTQKQENFARFYASSGDGKASAVQAGYSELSAKVTASRLLKNPQVKKRINSLLEKSYADNAVTLDGITRELSAIFFHGLSYESLAWHHKLKAGELLLRVLEFQALEKRITDLEGFIYENAINTNKTN